MLAEKSVPILKLPTNERIKQLEDVFHRTFKKKPEFYVRVPGRVNLIGEHIDYSGYGVCPMALEQDILLAISAENDCILRIHNMNPNYPMKECELKDLKISISDDGPEWHQYFLCGVVGVFDILTKECSKEKKGMNVTVSGTIPPSAGLSSSSALVSAAALATAYSHKLNISKEELASLCAKCERYIGTEGGGMDQAIAFLATEGSAKFIEFSPLRSTDIKLPKGAVFVIAHSLAKLNKAATADFNCRVVECRLAAQLLAHNNLLMDYDGEIKTLGQFQKATNKNLSDVEEIVKQTLHEEPYTKTELERLLKAEGRLEQQSLTHNTRMLESFRLRQRALHVFQEAIRVEQFISICRKSANDINSLKQLGQLMMESHESLKNLYECSHPQLDKLVELSKDVTLGARLTGAGWAGCIVAMVLTENVDKYKKILEEQYYRHLGLNDINSVVFVTKPQSGACIYLESD